MSEAQNVNWRTGRMVGAVLSVAVLAACTEGAETGFLQAKKPEATEEVTRNANSTAKLLERDVEAPDVFSVSEAGLWDGRPSLGGVWVAHPDVVDPERVIIRNTANNKFVVGALFRREREIPGPRIQASSDAAAALGMLAGAPVQLSVTALRREEIQPEPEVVEETEVSEAAPEAEAENKDIAIAAAAAIGAGTTTEAAAAATSEAVDAAGATAEAVKPKRRPWFRQGLFANKKKEEQSETLAALPEEPEVTATELPAVKPAEEAVKETASISDTQADKPEEVVLAAAGPTPKKQTFAQRLFGKKKQPVGEPLSAITPQPVVATTELPAAEPANAASGEEPEAAKPAKASLTKPYIQIGIFNVEQNAETAAKQMRSAGIVPTVLEQSSKGKTFWRVVVGPAQSRDERSALLDQIKGVGFSDAYAVTN